MDDRHLDDNSSSFEKDLDNIYEQDFYDSYDTIHSNSKIYEEDMSYDENLNSYSDGLDHTKEHLNDFYDSSVYSNDENNGEGNSGEVKVFFKRIWFVMVIIVSLAVTFYFYPGLEDMFAVNRTSKSEVSISIPKGSSRAEIAKTLHSAGVVEDEDFFKNYLYVFKGNTKFTKGDYTIPQNLEYAGIVNYLTKQSNRTDVVFVTITEGMNIQECGVLLENQNICKKEEFYEACKSNKFDSQYSFLNDITNTNERYYKLEGYLYPDTYKFYLEWDPFLVISTMLENYIDRIIDENNDINGLDGVKSIKDLSSEKGYTMDQVLNMASIVQAEAADVSDMKIIAGILQNRMKPANKAAIPFLGCDSTVYYPYRTKSSAPSGYESKYNTYKVEGLPAGPICNPGMDAIYSVLNPTPTNYLYFAHDKNGKAYYATSEQGHATNLRKIK